MQERHTQETGPEARRARKVEAIHSREADAVRAAKLYGENPNQTTRSLQSDPNALLHDIIDYIFTGDPRHASDRARAVNTAFDFLGIGGQAGGGR